MDVTTVVHAPPSLPQAPGTPTHAEGTAPRPVAPAESGDKPEAHSKERKHADVAPPPSLGPNTRLQLEIDPRTHRVFGRVIDTDTGRELREIPAKEIRNMQALMREALGPLVDRIA